MLLIPVFLCRESKIKKTKVSCRKIWVDHKIEIVQIFETFSVITIKIIKTKIKQTKNIVDAIKIILNENFEYSFRLMAIKSRSVLFEHFFKFCL